MTGYAHIQSLSGAIFRTVLSFVIVVVALFAVSSASVLFFTYERNAETALLADAEDVAQALSGMDDAAAAAALASQFPSETRTTLISADGTVLFESDVQGDYANHADRPEVIDAAQNGVAVTNRYSDTLKTDTLYAAVRLDNGSTLRLAQTRNSLASFAFDIIIPVFALFFIIIIATYALSRAVVRRIMKPIDALDFTHPLDNDIYEEMAPLLTRIDDQQQLLKHQNAELARAENMRKEFSANVSHEMKTPLTVISGYAELLKNNIAKPEDRQHFAQLIFDEAQELRALIEDVLVISRLDETGTSDDLCAIDLQESARVAAERLRSLASSADVRVSVEGSPVWIFGREMLCEQIFHNLIENGIRYNHPGGVVTVFIGRDDHGRAVARVTDDGIGIPPELREKVFERFFRVEKSRSKETGGTGLGLAIVKHAVMNMGGTIEVHGAPNGGTCFEVILPSTHEPE